MGDAVDFLNDAFTVGTMGLVDLKKGRVYVPFSGASARAGARAIAGSSATLLGQSGARKTINRAIDSPAGRMAGTAAAIASGIGTGYGVGAGLGGTVGGISSSTAGATAGGIVASSVAQAEAINQQMPELKAHAPVGNENQAVQRAIAEAASRRSRSRSARSTILSKNFLSPTNPGLKEYYGS